MSQAFSKDGSLLRTLNQTQTTTIIETLLFCVYMYIRYICVYVYKETLLFDM